MLLKGNDTDAFYGVVSAITQFIARMDEEATPTTPPEGTDTAVLREQGRSRLPDSPLPLAGNGQATPNREDVSPYGNRT